MRLLLLHISTHIINENKGTRRQKFSRLKRSVAVTLSFSLFLPHKLISKNFLINI